jgi:hypothetical protein
LNKPKKLEQVVFKNNQKSRNLNKLELEQKEGKFLNKLELRFLNSFVLVIIVVCSSRRTCSSRVKMVGESPKEEKSVEERLFEDDDEPVEEKATSDKKAETPKRLSKEEKEKLRDDLREGKILQKDLAVKYGISFEYVSKLAKKWGYSRDAKAAERELINHPAVEDHITKATTRVVQEEATARIDEILDTGKYCVDKFAFKASLNDMKLIAFLDKCVEFYSDKHGRVEQMQKDLDFQQSVITLLVDKFSPMAREIAKKEDIREAALTQLLLTGKVQEELLLAFLRT